MHWTVALLLVCGCGRLEFIPTTDATSGDGLPQTPNNFVFVTSRSVTLADLPAGLASADDICNSLALDAGLPGTYVAWLSDSTTSALARLGAARGWVRVDGKPFSDTTADMVANRVLHPISLDERGSFVSDQVYTATSALGTAGADCLGWSNMTNTVSIGFSSRTFEQWTESGNSLCTTPGRLYCFGVSRDAPLERTVAAGRRAFVLSAMPTLTTGINQADGLCQSEADAANLGGTFRALLPTLATPAAMRFSASGPPWVRLDGVALGPVDRVLKGGVLDAPLNVDAQGDYQPNWIVRTGSTAPAAVATDTCGDWTVTDFSVTRAGGAADVAAWFLGPSDAVCGNGTKHYCFEQ